MRKTIAQIRAAGFEWPLHDAITANVARTGDEVDLAQTLVNLEKARAVHQRQIDEAWAFKQDARASGWEADFDDFTDARDDHLAQLRAHATAIEYVRDIVAAFHRLPLRLQPEAPTKCGEYDLDALVVEEGAAGDLDFRLELGQGTMIHWALPAARNDRLRLVLVDSAVAAIEDRVLVEDPFACDLKLAWQGELARLPDGGVVTSVALDIVGRSYRFRADIRETTGAHRVIALEHHRSMIGGA